jgi:acyl carrier protein
MDEQVKLRGFRIELGEIEAVLARQPGVGQVVAVLHASPAGERCLIAYWTAAAAGAGAGAGGAGGAGGDGEAADAVALRACASRALPAYMIPTAFVRLDEVPLTPAGKVDRRRLAALAPPAAGAQSAAVAARGPLEQGIAEAYAELLGLQAAGAHDDFFALGGHSLLATRLVSRIRDTFAVELSLADVFEAPSVAGLAACVERLRGAGGRAVAGPLRAAPRHGALPLSFAQNPLWLIAKKGGGAGYHQRLELALHGPLDRHALQRALDAVVARHETLRTRFLTEGGNPRQVVDAPCSLPLHVIDRGDVAALARGSEQARVRALRDTTAEDGRRPFDLERGPLVRAALLRFADDDAVLVLSFHHIVADGWSYQLLAREVAAHYRAFTTGAAPGLPPLPVQYADFAVWQRGWMTDEALAGQLRTWRRQLAGSPPVLELPADRPRPAVQSFAGAACRIDLGRALRDDLAALAREQHATLAMTCLAAFQALLSRVSGQAQVVVGSPVANRTRVELEGLIGFFVNSLVLRADLSGDPEFVELLARVRATSLLAYDNQDLPFERLVDAVGGARDPGRTPLFQVVFAMNAQDAVEFDGGDVRMRLLDTEVSVTRFDLELHLFDGPAGLLATLVYATALFDEASARRLLRQYATLLAAVVATPHAPVSRLPLLGDAERRLALSDADGPVVDVPGSGRVHQLVEEQARRRPGVPAAVHGSTSLDYAELNARANRVARVLRRMGARRDMLVGLCVGRGVELVVGLLGILKSGAAYVPLDPAYPAERLAFMLQDAGVSLLVTEAGLLASLPAHGAEVLCLDGDRARLAAESGDDLDARVERQQGHRQVILR